MGFKSFLNSYREKWRSIPSPIRSFLIKGLIIFLCWKLVYSFFLLPGRIIDEPLTQTVGKHVVIFLNKMAVGEPFHAVEKTHYIVQEGVESYPVQTVLYYEEIPLSGIGDPCNGLEVFVLYLGFIIAFPSSLIRKIIFIPTGIAIIYAANIARFIGLIWLQWYKPGMLEFAHDYLYKGVIYFMIFLIWVVFTRNLSLEEPNKNYAAG
jgi:exosortase/archaeosortase family protein